MNKELIDKVYSLINKHYADNYHEKRSDFCYELSKIIVASLKLDEGKVEEAIRFKLKNLKTRDGYYIINPNKYETSGNIAKALCANPTDVITVEGE